MRSLRYIVILESLIIVVICVARIRLDMRRGVSSPIDGTKYVNCLYEALDYEASADKFASLVKWGPELMSFIPPGASNSILALCAEANQTNYVQILITNGANVDRAIMEESSKGNEKAVQLLRSMIRMPKP